MQFRSQLHKKQYMDIPLAVSMLVLVSSKMPNLEWKSFNVGEATS